MTVLEFINHASYLVRSGQTALLHDPWLDGSAFDCGWDLLVPTSFGLDDFRSVTHIWFSHEHPDHFSPTNLKAIPAEQRAKITVLYQNSADHRVAKFCKSLNFKTVIELKANEWIQLGPGVEFLCTPHDNGDSWCATRTPNGLIINLNDCVVRTPAECRKILNSVGPVRLLATQFSYANWVANPGDSQAMAAAAAEKLSWMKTQINTLRPNYVLPFASFVYFSHEDNWFMNEGMTTIESAVQFIREQTQAPPVVLFPGDRWDFPGGAPDAAPALRRYAEARERTLSQGFRHRSQKVPLDALISHGEQFVSRLRKRNGWMACALLPSVIYLDDHNTPLKVSVGGVGPVMVSRNRCDLACKSDALDYCFLNDWGGRTLDINARFYAPPSGRYWRFKAWATLASFNSRGEGVTEILKTITDRLYHKFAT